MVHGCAARIFTVWIDDTAEQVRLKAVCAKVVRRWTRRSIGVMFTTWVTHSAMSDFLTQISARMRNTCVFRAFSTWQNKADESSRVRDILGKIALRLKNSTIFKAFSAWSESGNADACLQLAGMRVARKWSWKAASKVHVYWAGKTRHSRLMVASARKVMTRMIHAGLYVAFWSWQQNCAAASWHANVLRRAALRLTKSALIKALSKWYDSVAETQHDTIMQCVAEKSQVCILRSRVDAAIVKWARYTYRKRQLRHAASLICKTRNLLPIRQAWEGLCHLTSSIKLRRFDAMRRLDALISQLVWRPRRRQMRKICLAWATLTARCRTLLHAGACVVRKGARKTLLKSFDDLLQKGAIRKKTMRVITMSWRRTSHSRLNLVFQDWVTFRFRQAKMRKIVRMLMTRARQAVVYQHFHKWLRSRTQEKGAGEKNQLIVKRSLHMLQRNESRSVLIVLEHWHKVCAHYQQIHSMSERIHTIFIARLQRNILSIWHDFAHAQANLRSRLGRVAHRLGGMSFTRQRLGTERVLRIVRAWRDWITQKKAQTENANRLIAEWHFITKTRVFIMLLDHVADSKQHKIRDGLSGIPQ